MSRYYDPVTHRFVNADGYFQSGGDVLDANMCSYCGNNPVMHLDVYGTTVYTVGISGLLCFELAFSPCIYLLMLVELNLLIERNYYDKLLQKNYIRN